jgi:hypothetical protein
LADASISAISTGYAGVAELVDARRSGRRAAKHVGSIPTARTRPPLALAFVSALAEPVTYTTRALS